MKIIYKQIDYQQLFHESTKPKVYLSAGLGSGKTYSLVMKIIKLMSDNYGLAGGLLAPSLKMFKRDVLPTIREICNANNIRYQYNKSDSVFFFPNFKATIYIFHSEDDGQSIRGPNLAWGAINEVTLCSFNAYTALLGRIRLKKAKIKQIVMSGSPESFNWCYEYFIENPREDTDLIFGDTRKNKFISEDYVKMLADSYDDLMFQQFVEGKFVNLNGRAAVYAFNRQNHLDKDIKRIDHLPIWITMDFNVHPMTATIFQRMQFDSKHVLEAIDEVCLNSSNTEELCRVLKEKIGPNYTQAVLFPDPAGSHRSTNSNKSDIDILKQNGFLDIRYKRSIISVRDCLNALNNLFDKDKIKIHPRCKNLIADLEQCILKQGTSELDKRDPKRTHALDGLKNMADYEFPVIRSRAGYREVIIR